MFHYADLKIYREIFSHPAAHFSDLTDIAITIWKPNAGEIGSHRCGKCIALRKNAQKQGIVEDSSSF
jgi:hypothetical protein